MSTEARFNKDHDEVQQLLPWFVTQQLAPAQAAMVDEHVRHCAACRADVDWENRMHAAAPALPSGLDPEAALARLMPRLDERTPAPAAASALGQRLRDWLFGHGWMPWALACQALLVVGLAVQVVAGNAGQGGEQYRALGNPGQGRDGNIVVMFDPTVGIGQVQRIMQASGARIVDGPTVTGAYMLSVPPARQAQAIAELKAQADVQLAEPLNLQGQP